MTQSDDNTDDPAGGRVVTDGVFSPRFIPYTRDELAARIAAESLPWSRPARRQRRRPIARLIAEAERSGKTVTAVTLPDGTTLRLGGQAAPAKTANPWDEVLHAPDKKRSA
jgi:hypothetical protein